MLSLIESGLMSLVAFYIEFLSVDFAVSSCICLYVCICLLY